MNSQLSQFTVTVAGSGLGGPTNLTAGIDFRLDDNHLSESLCLPLAPIQQDLVRLGLAVYVLDRLCRRNPPANDRSSYRDLELTVPVSDPDFWNAMAPMIVKILEFLSDDQWNIHFKGGAPRGIPEQFLFAPPAEYARVCLYSGGLDSLAGLTARLGETNEHYFALTALHQPHQRQRIGRHIQKLGHRFGHRITSTTTRTTLIRPVRLDRQELSQRCRSFLFCSLAGATAARLQASEVEIFENGVGALNLPLMTGMLWGGRSTRGCHPRVLMLMGELITQMAGRRIAFTLPFRNWTKAQMVARAAELGLATVVSDAVSCVHYPMRVHGRAKQCGLCPGCLGHRQAVLAAGLTDISIEEFKSDFLDPQCSELNSDDLMFLRAQLLQMADLYDLAPDGSRPQILRRHLHVSQVVTTNYPVEPWISLLARYRDEWMNIVRMGRERKCHWATWLDGTDVPVSVLSDGEITNDYQRSIDIRPQNFRRETCSLP